MVRFFRQTLALLLLTAALSGCVYLVIGGFAALGGYVVSPDTVEGILTGHNKQEVWEASIEVLSVMGIVVQEDETEGLLVAKTQGTRVRVTVAEVSKSTSKITIKARKAFFPRIRVAQDVYIKIVNDVKGE
jgi:hypothetical protein